MRTVTKLSKKPLVISFLAILLLHPETGRSIGIESFEEVLVVFSSRDV